MNDHLALICGVSATGKSMSLMNLKNVLYANCESGKKLPFKTKDSNYKEVTITDPYQVYEVFDHANENPDAYDVLVIDGLNYLMDMYESVHIRNSSDGRTAWGNYAEFFKNMMQQYVSRSTIPVLFTAHTRSIYDEAALAMETKVPIKGALANQGVESYFSTIVSTKRMKVSDLEGYENDLLNITERDKRLGYKYVFQTMQTADTVEERMRSPLDLFSIEETFIDNDAAALLQRLNEYYD